MRRRDFVKAAAVSAVTWPLAARAQQPAKETAMPVVGFLHGGSATAFPAQVAAFRDGLRSEGFVDGQNIAIVFRWAEGHFDKLPELTDELIRAHAAVIAAVGGDIVAHAAMKETSETPIVFMIGQDAVKSGLVASLNRPTGNVTGVTLFVPLLVPKQMELIHMIATKATVMAVLRNPDNATVLPEPQELEEAARANGMKLLLLNATTLDEIDASFATASAAGAGAMLIPGDVFFTSRRDRMLALAVAHAIPTIYPFREYVTAGGLVSYGNNLNRVARLAATYVARILRGEKPGELPVEQPSKFELSINLKTAKLLRLMIPDKLLATADEVIE